jgi:hypothetical protein
MTYEDFKIQPDQALLAQYETSTTGASVHERNRLRTNYLWCCKSGRQDGVEQYEAAMRRLMAIK